MGASSDLARARLAAQRLLPGTEAPDIGSAARAVCGIQAQEMRAMGLALRARVPGITRQDVDGSDLVRTWTVRGTVHLIGAGDWPWLHALCAPRYGPYFARLIEKRGALEIANGMFDDVLDLLSEQPLSRAELLPELYERSHEDLGQFAINVVMPFWAMSGRVLGLPDGRFRTVDPPPALSEDEALEIMGRRFQEGYGPVTAEDLAYWSGLPLSKARRALDAAGAVEHEDPKAEPKPLQLLPAFDTVFLGYKSRDWIVPPDHGKQVMPGGGILKPVVLADGRAVGTWKLAGKKVQPAWFGDPPPADALAQEEADVRRFLGQASKA